MLTKCEIELNVLEGDSKVTPEDGMKTQETKSTDTSGLEALFS